MVRFLFKWSWSNYLIIAAEITEISAFNWQNEETSGSMSRRDMQKKITFGK